MHALTSYFGHSERTDGHLGRPSRPHHPHIVVDGLPPPHRFIDIYLLGVTADVVMGSWLLKAELAHIDGLRYASSGDKRLGRYDALVGVEYSGISDQSVALEAVGRYLDTFSASFSGPPDYKTEVESQLVIRHTANFQHETFASVIAGTFFSVDAKAGAIYQASLTYKPMDAWRVTGGIIVYASGHNTYSQTIGKNDRIFLEIRHDF